MKKVYTRPNIEVMTIPSEPLLTDSQVTTHTLLIFGAIDDDVVESEVDVH